MLIYTYSVQKHTYIHTYVGTEYIIRYHIKIDDNALTKVAEDNCMGMDDRYTSHHTCASSRKIFELGWHHQFFRAG